MRLKKEITMFYFGVCNYNPQVHTARGKNILCGPYKNREEAKKSKILYNIINYDRTDIFEAFSDEEAHLKMESNIFNKL